MKTSLKFLALSSILFMAKTAIAIEGTFPIDISEDLQWDSTELVEGNVVNKYTFKALASNELTGRLPDVVHEMLSSQVRKICDNADYAKVMNDGGKIIRHFAGSDGVQITTTSTIIDSCGDDIHYKYVLEPNSPTCIDTSIQKDKQVSKLLETYRKHGSYCSQYREKEDMNIAFECTGKQGLLIYTSIHLLCHTFLTDEPYPGYGPHYRRILNIVGEVE